MNTVNEIKDKIQKEAVKSIYSTNTGSTLKPKCRALLTMCTGSGKSRCALMFMDEIKAEKIALLVPTEKLRDDNWKQEYDDWGFTEYWDKTTRLCYASASKYSLSEYDLVILDECHRITELSYQFFIQNTIHNIVALTATPPQELVKIQLISKMKLTVTYHLSIDDAVRLGIVADYNIDVIFTTLNSIDKVIKAGNKSKPFLQTELEAYNYFTKTINFLINGFKKDMAIYGRLRLLNDLPSKTKVAQRILEYFNMSNNKILIFCGSINQAETLCDNSFHSKSKDTGLKAFMKDEIKYLSCVKALNEGISIPNLDIGMFVAFTSKELELTQRIGRIIRWREGHKAKLIIICCKDTQDEIWLEKAMINIDKDKVSYYDNVEQYLETLN